MHRGLLGKKLGMATLFSSEGVQIPVTVLEVGPCIVTQIKTQTADGYNAVQVGFAEKRPERVNRALTGHFKKSGGKGYAFLAEIPVDDPSSHQLGEALTVAGAFKVGERVNVRGFTKGRGYSGVVKRWGFRGGKASHGSMFHRAPGSIGSSAWPSRVAKGRKLPGQYGNEKVTVKNMEVIDIRPDQNIMIVKGAVPGCKTGIVEVRKPKTVPKKK
jgi:large subunit ribosomal protein L3